MGIQAIPIYNKKTIKTWIANETGLLINEFQKNINNATSEIRAMIDNSTENTINQLDNADSLKNLEISVKKTTQVVDKMSKSNAAQYLDLGGSLNEVMEQLSSINSELKNRSQDPYSQGVNPSDGMFEAQFDSLEACVEQASTDVHMKLGNKVDQLEHILLALAMKNGVSIPELPDWEGEHAKLANQHLRKLQEQESALERKNQELINIKNEVESQARKLKQDREKMQREMEQNKLELRKQRMEAQAQIDQLESERKNQVEGSTPGSLSQEQIEELEQKQKEIAEAQKQLDKQKDEFRREKDQVIKTQESELLKIDRKTNEMEELKQEFKIEQKKIKAKREQLKKDEKHVEECKNDLEAIFEEIANKRNEVLGREEAVSTREKELRKLESQVQNILGEKKQLTLARQKMEELRVKMSEDLKKKDEEIKNWKTKALSKNNSSETAGALEEMQKSFDKEKIKLIEKHNNEKKKLAVAARKKFQQDFQKEIESAANKVSDDKKLLEKVTLFIPHIFF